MSGRDNNSGIALRFLLSATDADPPLLPSADLATETYGTSEVHLPDVDPASCLSYSSPPTASTSLDEQIVTALLGINGGLNSTGDFHFEGQDASSSCMGASAAEIVSFSSQYDSESLEDWWRPTNFDVSGPLSHSGYQSVTTEAWCSHCHKHLKKSEQAKHMKRHLRPFKCQVANCKYNTKGFPTQTDLSRHAETVHTYPDQAGQTSYVCSEDGCTYKTWRRDNFGRHFKKKHPTGDLDLNKYIVRNNAQEHAASLDNKPLTTTLIDFFGDGLANALSGMGGVPDDDDYQSTIVPTQEGAIESSTTSLPRSVALSSDEDAPVMTPADIGVDLAGMHSMATSPDTASNRAYPLPYSTPSSPRPDSRGAANAKRRKGLDHRGFWQSRPPWLFGASGHEDLDCEAAIYSTPVERDFVLLSRGENKREDNKRKRASDGSDTENYGDYISEGDYASDGDDGDDGRIIIDDDDDGDDAGDDTRTRDSNNGKVSNAPPPAHEKELKDSCVAADAVSEDASQGLGDDELQKMIQTIKKSGRLGDAQEIISQALQPKAKDDVPVLTGAGATPAAADSPARPVGKPSTQSRAKRFACEFPGCDSSFATKASLRKHAKRHDRPYSCTNLRCTKSQNAATPSPSPLSGPATAKGFGSKGDWKRHELAQHMQVFLVKAWQCSERAVRSGGGGRGRGRGRGRGVGRRNTTNHASTAVCEQIFSDEAAFTDHLGKAHCIDGTAAVAKRVRAARPPVLPDSLLRGFLWFWCGFCKAQISENTPPLGVDDDDDADDDDMESVTSVVESSAKGKNNNNNDDNDDGSEGSPKSTRRASRGSHKPAAPEDGGSTNVTKAGVLPSWAGWPLARRQQLVQQRFDHIDNHFMGRAGPPMRMEQWVDGDCPSFGASPAATES